jgi:hypothetical protein
MYTLRLDNHDYHTFAELQEKTTQSPAIETPFAQDLLREFEEFMLVEWLSDQNYHKYRRLEALHYARHNFDSAKLLEEIYWAINLDELKKIDITDHVELLSISASIDMQPEQTIDNNEVIEVNSSMPFVEVNAIFRIKQGCDEPLNFGLMYRNDKAMCMTPRTKCYFSEQQDEFKVSLGYDVDMGTLDELPIFLKVGALGRHREVFWQVILRRK